MDAIASQIQSAAAPICRRRPTPAARVVALFAVCVVCKACLVPLPGTLGGLPGWLARLALASSGDGAYCLALGCLIRICRDAGMRLAADRRRIVDRGAAAVCFISALFAVVSVPIFLTLNVQVTLPMLAFLGSWRTFGQSVFAALTPAVVVAVALLPPAWRLSVRGLDAVGRIVGARIADQRLRRAAFPTLVVAFVAYIAVGQSWIDAHWTERSLWQYRISRNPHWNFLQSIWYAPPAPLPLSDWRREAYAELEPRPVVDATQTAAQRRTNVVLLVLESVGAESMHAFGGEHPTTPELEKLAGQAWFFDAAYAQCPSSAKSLVSLLSGSYPRPDPVEQTRRANQGLPGIAEAVRAQGYRTGFIHSGDWSWRGGEDYIRSTGFEHFQDARGLPLEEGSWGTGDDWLLGEGLRWIDAADDPFFLLLWTIETHHPYRCGPEPRDYCVADAERNRYLNAVAEADRRIGRLWSELERRGLAESTVVVVTGDHGEAFGTHGQRLHIFGVYEENVRVPLVLLHDGKRLPVGRTNRIVEHVDLAPTLAELCGAHGSEAWQGRSLLAPAGDDRAYFYTVWDPVLFGLRDGEYKYISELGRGEFLFHLPSDPEERHNLAGFRPEQVAELRRRIAVLRSYQNDYLSRTERSPRPVR